MKRRKAKGEWHGRNVRDESKDLYNRPEGGTARARAVMDLDEQLAKVRSNHLPAQSPNMGLARMRYGTCKQEPQMTQSARARERAL